MFNMTERKQTRLNSCEGLSLMPGVYNLVIGLITIYGLAMNAIICKHFSEAFIEMNPITLTFGYIICCTIGSLMSGMSRNPLVSFIGYNLIVIPVGALLSTFINQYDPYIVSSAAFATAGVTTLMTALGIIYPNFFLGLGRTLSISLLATLLVEIILGFFGVHTGFIDFIVVGVFSMYIGFDLARSQQYPKTLDNAIDCAVDIYLDIINIFLRILSLLSKKDD